MLYEPSYEFHLVTEEAYPAKILQIDEDFRKYATTGQFTLKNGLQLAYSYILTKDAVGTVILLHGYTEFYQKYTEIAWYFLNQGYNVFTYDQRGHGYSSREVEDLSLAYIHSYEDYANDLSEFIDGLVEIVAPMLPISLYSHSMGGAIALLYMQTHPSRIQRAILSSPMIVPYTDHVPRPIVRSIIKNDIRKKGEKARFRFAGTFNPNPKYERSHDRSYERFIRNLNLRIEDVHYQNSSSTNGWMLATIDIPKKLLNTKKNAAITSEIFILSGGLDHVVKTRYHKKVAKQLPKAKQILFPEARHSIYSADDMHLIQYYNLMFGFMKDGLSSIH